MSDDQIINDEHLEDEEDIDPQEVERVAHALADLIETVESETIHEHLQVAFDEVSALVEWDDDEEDEGEAVAA